MVVGALRSTNLALKNAWRNLWLSVITVFLLVLTTFSITLVVSLNVVGQQLIRAVESKVDVDLFFHDYTTEAEILATQSFVQEIEGVSQVVYISKEAALEQFRASHADDQAVIASLDELEENVLPASLIVRTENIELYPAIIDRVTQSEHNAKIERTDFTDNQAIIGRISGITDRLYQIGLVVSLIFIIISVIFIFNTIRITIYSHREEIGIMKLVGATNWFIRSPFILEGILLGALAGLFTLGLFYVLLYLSDPALTTFFSGYDFSVLAYFQAHALQLILAEIFGAILLSIISSMIAITRYLKV